jgi:hypothetical protein
MKKALNLILIAILCSIVVSCKTHTVLQTDTVYLHDSITVYDTVHVHDTVAVAQSTEGQLSILKNSNDSLLSSNATLQAKLDYVASKVKQGKLNTDTIHKSTQYADAWACVVDNDLQLWLKQKPIVLDYDKVNSNTKVSNNTTKSSNKDKTITVTKPFYDDMWFWTTVVLTLCMTVMILVLLLKSGVLRI